MAMTEKQFLMGVARVCQDVSRNAAHSFGVGIKELNKVSLEVSRRARESGITMEELWPSSPENNTKEKRRVQP